jgi:ATP-dependent protease ClpP protease subunit
MTFYLHSAFAAEIDHIALANQAMGFILVKGPLEPGDEQKFNRIAQMYTHAAVLLISEGGNLLAGIEIGRIIRVRNFSTGVAPGTLCASACAMAWLGGTSRYMSANSRVGFHAAYIVKDGVARETGLGNAIVGAYVTQLALPMSAVIYITAAAPHEMTWLTAEDARRVGIDVEVLEIQPNQFRGDNSRAANSRSVELPSAHSVEPALKIPPLARDERWLIVASRTELSDAITEAKKYKERFSRTMVFLSSNGKYAITIGKYSIEPSERTLMQFKSSRLIPQDSYFSHGARFVTVAWQ